MKLRRLREFTRLRNYLFAGSLVAIIDGGFFIFLVHRLGPFRASLISGAIALVAGWLLSSRFVFRDKYSNSRSAAEYVLLGGANYLIGNGALIALLGLGANRFVAKFLSMVLVTFISFFVQLKYIFAKKNHKGRTER